MHGLKLLRRTPRLALGLVAVVVAGAVAYAATTPAIQTFTPRSANQITNIDVLRQQIRNYYGDPLGTGTFSPDSSYANETERVAAFGARLLAHQGFKHHHWWKNGQGQGQNTQTKAIVLDVDDTTLATWNYEVFSNWAFNPTTNATYVLGQLFPPVPGMVDMVNQAAQEGYAIIYITGRPATQEAATLGNLTADGVGVDAGYPAPTKLNDGEDGLFTKPALADYPPYLTAACSGDPNGGTCTTVHYKSATRQHIESLGYDIVANFGDQFSDLQGGFADNTFKLPNPNYFLP
jgi:predicted secreted acid phosphatase